MRHTFSFIQFLIVCGLLSMTQLEAQVPTNGFSIIPLIH
jgi:hypothetical protein